MSILRLILITEVFKNVKKMANWDDQMYPYFRDVRTIKIVVLDSMTYGDTLIPQYVMALLCED